MLKLDEIKLSQANVSDFARAFNYSMRKSKKTANLITAQLGLLDRMKPSDVFKIYPADTFTKEGKLKPESYLEFAESLWNTFRRKKSLNDYNMLDFANGIIKHITKTGLKAF